MARLDISAMVIGVTGLALAIADAEIEYETQAAAPVSVPLRVLQSASTAALLALICARTSIALLLGRETGDFPVRASLRTSGLVWQLAAELVLCSVHIPPGLPARTFTFHTLDLFHEYSFASLITVPMLLRLYLVARVYLNHAPYTSQRCAHCRELPSPCRLQRATVAAPPTSCARLRSLPHSPPGRFPGA